MTEDQIKTFIKEKIAPIFDGMSGKDVLKILDTLRFYENLLAEFTISLKKP